MAMLRTRAVLALLVGCSGTARSPSTSGTTEQVATTCAQNVATANTHRERGELRAALAALDHVPDRRVMRSLAEAAPCPARDTLAKQLRAELQLDVPLAPASPADAAESRRLHAAALEAIADGKHDDAIRDLEAAHARWPHPQLQVALFRAHTLAGRGTQARVAADRAIALAERIGGRPGTIGVQRTHAEQVSDVVYDPTGRWLVTASEHELVVWEHATGQPLRRLEAGGRIRALFALDGAVLVGTDDGVIRTWDIHRGQITGEREVGDTLRSMVLSPDRSQLAFHDGDRIVALGLGATELARAPVRWQVDAGETLLVHADAGKTLVTAGEEPAGARATVTLRDAATGRIERQLRVPGVVPEGGSAIELVNDVAVSPDGKLVAVAGKGRVHVWDRATGRKVVTFSSGGAPGELTFVDNARLRTEAALFAARTGKPLGPAARRCHGADHPRGGERACAAFSSGLVHPRGLVLHASDGTRRALGHVDTPFHPRTLDLSPDGKRLTIAHGNAPVVVDLEAGRVKAFARLRGLHAATIANDGRLAIAAGKQLVVLDGNGTQLHAFELSEPVSTVAFRPDGDALALAVGHGLVVLDARTWKELRRQQLGDKVLTLGWSSDGQRLYAHAVNRFAKVWDAVTGRELASFPPGGALAMAPDARRAGIVGIPSVILDLETRATVPLVQPEGNTFGVAALLPDGRTLLVARPDEIAWLDAKAAPRTLPWSPGGYADQLVVHPSGRHAIASNTRRHVVIYDLAARAPVVTLAIADGGAWAAFDARGRTDGDPALPGLELAFGKDLALPADVDPARRHPGLLAIRGL